MDSHEFLHLLWSNQPGSGYLMLARRVNGDWDEIPAVEYSEHLTLDPLIFFPGEGDDYFCPQLFSQPHRRKENALPSRWLYADLDVVDPRNIPDGITPTISLQTSPGRFQAFWLLRLPLEPHDHSQLNRNLTYALEADKGGWDITQVLRIPGTYNRKYMRPYRVRVLNHDPTLVYDVKVFENYFQNIRATLTTDLVDMPPLIMPVEKPLEIQQKFWPQLTDRAHYLLKTSSPQPGDDRSARLWELECLLLEAGLTPEETFVLARNSIWNKFAGRHGGDTQLWSEVQKADARVKVTFAVSEGRHRERPLRRIKAVADAMTAWRRPKAGWLIENWWTTGSQGIIAGLPKTFKSLIALEMAVSVASGTPFLGHFKVKKPGPALVVQLENSEAMVLGRLDRIFHNRGVVPVATHDEYGLELQFPDLHQVRLFLYEDHSFDMTLAEDRKYLENQIRENDISMVVFDPLYMMLGGADENNSKEIRPVLNWLTHLKTTYNCAVVVVHHFTKSASHPLTGMKQGGAKLMGSTLLWGWLECGIYLQGPEQTESGYMVLDVDREFREKPPIFDSHLYLKMGKPKNLDEYRWTQMAVVEKGENAEKRSNDPK